MKINLSLVAFIALLLVAEVVPAAEAVRQPAPVMREVSNNRHQYNRYLTKDVRLRVLRNYKLVTGHKLTLKQKIALKMWQWKGAKLFQQGKEATPRQKQLGKMSLIFGVAAFVLIPIPVLNILSVPSAIAAIILGIASLKGNNNTNGIIGLVLGGAFLLLGFIAFLVLILVLGGLFN